LTVRRVLSVIETLGRGGAERLLVTQHRHLDPKRFATQVVALFEPTPLAEELADCGVSVVRMALPGPRSLPIAVARLRSVLRQWRPDVVHTHLYYANIAGRLAARGLAPVFTTLHNPDYSFEDPGTIRFRAKKWLDRKTGRGLTSRFIAVSSHVKRDFESHLGFQDIEVLHNFIDVDEVTGGVAAADREGQRRRLGVATDELLVLHVGRLHAQKGQDLLLRALARLQDGPGSWRAVFVGAGETRGLEALASSLDLTERVVWAGPVNDVRPFYAAADVFAFPSRYEAFGIALLEAMAAGLPSVVSDAEGIAEVITSETALTARVDDVQHLAERLANLLTDRDLRRALGAAAIVRAHRFDVGVQLPKLEGWYLDA